MQPTTDTTDRIKALLHRESRVGEEGDGRDDTTLLRFADDHAG